MSEAWILELLSSVRDVARQHGMIRLAEHVDDAMLIASSEFHEAAFMAESGAVYVGTGGEAVRGVARQGLN